MSRRRVSEKNRSNWFPTDQDYELVFLEVNDEWRECSHNLPKYSNMLLCDFLTEIQLIVPDYCQFLRVIRPDMHIEYRAYGGRVRIDVEIYN